MDVWVEARISFVVAGGNPSEPFDLAEEVLDEMAPLVHLEVAGNAGGAVGLGRDHGLSAPLVQVSADRIGVEGLVGEQGCEIKILEQRGDADAVVVLPREQ